MATKSQPSYYAILPAAVRYDSELMDKAKLIYAEISALANREGYCYATNKYFADLYAISTRQVITIIGNLEAKGYVKIDREGSKRKIYLHSAHWVKKTSQEGEENFTSRGEENFTQNIINNNNKNNIPYTPEFERWYARYPNKFNKRQTFKNWLTALKTYSVKDLYNALLAYERYIQQNNVNPEYITRSTNFLGRKGEFVGWLEQDVGAPQNTDTPEQNTEFSDRLRRFT